MVSPSATAPDREASPGTAASRPDALRPDALCPDERAPNDTGLGSRRGKPTDVAAHNAAAAMALFDGLVGPDDLLEVVVSPGSRSTPLTLAAAAHPHCRIHVVLDERAAGFLALGLGRRRGRPAVLVCTSGSAGVHYGPAVVEAHHAAVPLVAVTANRPPELHDVGAPQTMRQHGLFGDWLRHASLLPVPGPAVDPQVFRGAGARARAEATGNLPGPVHLDAPFREPLWQPNLTFPAPVATADTLRGRPYLDPAGLSALRARLHGRRGLIVVGPASPAASPAPTELLGLGRALGWPVLADPVSGLRFGHDEVIATYDVACRSHALDALVPEVVLAVGLPPTSKALNLWIRRHRVPVVRLDPAARRLDPTGTLEMMVVADVGATARALVENSSVDGSAVDGSAVDGSAGDRRGARGALTPVDAAWSAAWREVEGCVRASMASELVDPTWSGHVVRALLTALPVDAQLHLASSMPIREVDAFSLTGGHPCPVHASRGVNGIDGTIATAAGEAIAHPGPTVALVGDLALLHDLDGLETLPGDLHLTVVAIDNDGGGIFSYLPIAAHEDPATFRRLFLTPRRTDPVPIVKALGHRAARVRLDHLHDALAAAVTRPGLDVLVVPVDRGHDVTRHREVYATVDAALAGLTLSGRTPAGRTSADPSSAARASADVAGGRPSS